MNIWFYISRGVLVRNVETRRILFLSYFFFTYMIYLHVLCANIKNQNSKRIHSIFTGIINPYPQKLRKMNFFFIFNFFSVTTFFIYGKLQIKTFLSFFKMWLNSFLFGLNFSISVVDFINLYFWYNENMLVFFNSLNVRWGPCPLWPLK